MPEPLKLSQPEIVRDEESVSVSFNIGQAPIFYRILDPSFEPAKLGEVLISTALFFAMAEGRDIDSEVPASQEFLDKNQPLQAIFNRWFPQLHNVGVSAPARQLPERSLTPAWQPARYGAAVLFSGGVDSFLTALAYGHQLQTAIYIHGFDTKLEHAEYRSTISQHLHVATRDLGLHLIEVETNLRDYSDDVLFWGHYHHSMIAAVCQLLSNRFERVYIPSSYTFEQLAPWGQHPLTDHLWGTGDLEFFHVHNGYSRAAKAAAIADSEIARKHLRVCWENVDGAYNCGECEKCLRTMINLAITGKLDAFQHLFAKPLHVPDLLPHVCIDVPSHLQFLQNNINEAKRQSADPDLIEALQAVSTEAHIFFAAKAVAKRSGRHDGDYFASPAWRDHLLPKVRNELFDEQLTSDADWLSPQLLADLGRDEIFDLLWNHDRKWLRKLAK